MADLTAAATKGSGEPLVGDSLNLGQLRRIIAQQRHKPKENKYTFRYEDRDSVEYELGEWYSYDQESILNTAIFLFKSEHTSWTRSNTEQRLQIVKQHVLLLENPDLGIRSKSSAIIAYIAQGTYAEAEDQQNLLQCILQNCQLLHDTTVCKQLIAHFKICCESLSDDSNSSGDNTYLADCIVSLSTALYFIMTSTRGYSSEARAQAGIDGSFPAFLLNLLAQLCAGQEDGMRTISTRHMTQLLRQSILYLLGGRREIERCKAYQRVSHGLPKVEDKTAIITTPLDYAVFRTEIISKYPSYRPPPLGGLDTSVDEVARAVLPARTTSVELPVFVDGHWTATPAPSPPASIKGKKSLYTTDQSLPFPLPVAELQINRTPSSIEEGTRLFESRQRTTVPLAQLWQEQERFVRSERGWTGDPDLEPSHSAPGRHGDSLAEEEEEEEEEYADEVSKLAEVERMYSESLPDLQSCIAGLVSLLWNVASLNLPAAGLQSDKEIDPKIEESVANTRGWLFNEKSGGNEGKDGSANKGKSAREVEEYREMEVLFKSISGSLILLLKWFRVSHVLKFEYLTQLLLDSDWIHTFHQALLALNPVANVLEVHEDPRRAFFTVCLSLSEVNHQKPGNGSFTRSHEMNEPESDMEEEDEVDEDDKEEEEESTEPSHFEPLQKNTQSPDGRLNNDGPTKDQKIEFSWRTFYSTINFLAITQKIVKKKTHRYSLLVQAKTWLHLRRPLRVPHDLLQLYCLKLFKGQVPLCSRKWRQSNMKVITQIYMSCRPELREDWIAGTDNDTDLEEAKHQEAAIRALVLFHHTTRYPTQMRELGYADEDDSSQDDFFETELARRL